MQLKGDEVEIKPWKPAEEKMRSCRTEKAGLSQNSEVPQEFMERETASQQRAIKINSSRVVGEEKVFSFYREKIMKSVNATYNTSIIKTFQILIRKRATVSRGHEQGTSGDLLGKLRFITVLKVRRQQGSRADTAQARVWF